MQLLRPICVGTMLAIAPACGSAAFAGSNQSAAPVAFRTTVPEGFAEIAAPQSVVADVYYGGRRVGEARVTYERGHLTFDNPAAVAAGLPALSDPAIVVAALSADDLPSNTQLVCTPASRTETCGRIAPEVAAVIFDEARFRIDLFVNPRFLGVQRSDEQTYLPPPEDGVGLVNAMGLVAAGAADGPRYYNFQNQLVAGDADRRLRMDFGYATGFGFQADRLVVESDKPGWRYMGGAFWTPGSDLIGRQQVFGVGIQSQTDTRIDKDQIAGQPLIVFLNQRSRIDILRDGKVIASRVYEAGNQKLDTASLPSGAYDVVLRITEAGGATREERRFFSRNSSVPALGERVLFAYAGLLGDSAGSSFLNPTSRPFAQVGAAFRLNQRFALDATAVATDRAGLAQIGFNYLNSLANVRIAGVASSQGLRGGLMQVSSNGSGHFNFNFELRRMSLGKSGNMFGENGPRNAVWFGPGADISAIAAATGSFSQLSGSVSFSSHSLQLIANGSYRRDRGGLRTYSYGPAMRWEVLRRGSMRLSVNGDLAFTERGRSSFAGLTLQVLGGRSSISATGGVRRASEPGHDRSASVAVVQGAMQANDVVGGELNAGTSFEKDIDRKLINANLDYRGPTVSASADAIHNFGQGPERTQYSVGMQTTLLAGEGGLRLQGREQTESQLIVAIDGKEQGPNFEVLINEAAAGAVDAGRALALGLQSYRLYDVRIRPLGNAGPVLYDGQPRQVSLYPGTVTRLEWSALRLISVFGRIVDPIGKPMSNAAIAAPGGIARTDNLGYFQMEVTEEADLQVTAPGNGTCKIRLPRLDSKDAQVARLGDLTCATMASGRLMARAAD